jgi:hypothetical protein
MRVGKRAVGLFALAAMVLVGDVSALAARAGRHPTTVLPAPSLLASPAPAPAPPAAPAPSPTTVPPTTTTTAPPPPPKPGALPSAWTMSPWQGVGAWVDIYDWTNARTGGHPSFSLADIDRMAAAGVQTLFIQTSYETSPTAVAEEDRLMGIIQTAHARGIAVVGWFLPTLTNLDRDFQLLLAQAALPIDGLGVDIEARDVTNLIYRNQLLVALSQSLRSAMGNRVIAAITPSPVQIQVVNPRFWPDFPWPTLGHLYDVIAPMSYWSDRRGEWRSGALLTAADVDRIRYSTGRPDMPVHFIGGIANSITLQDVVGMVSSLVPRRILGASLYDWSTSQAGEWNLLAGLRRLAG